MFKEAGNLVTAAAEQTRYFTQGAQHIHTVSECRLYATVWDVVTCWLINGPETSA